MDLLILFIILWAALVVMGLVLGTIWNILASKFPQLDKILFAEETDRDGNPIHEDF